MKTEKKFRLLVIAQILLLITLLLIGAWWGTLLLKQSEEISSLQLQLGTQNAQTISQNLKLHKMLFWESATFFALLVMTSGFMLWFYGRDIRRTKKQQAFFASVTHELKTPLASIRLQAESLADSDEHKSNPLINRMLEDTSRLESQVNRTLELARIEGGGPILLESFPIKPHLESIIEYWNDSQAKPIHVKLNISNDWVQADKDALQIIFKNLLENSIKYSNQESLVITISSQKTDDNNLELYYQDNGNAFTGDLHSLGTLFYKGPQSKGTGVGLYLIQSLMKKMKGFVQFNPTQNGFAVKLHFQGGSHHE